MNEKKDQPRMLDTEAEGDSKKEKEAREAIAQGSEMMATREEAVAEALSDEEEELTPEEEILEEIEELEAEAEEAAEEEEEDDDDNDDDNDDDDDDDDEEDDDDGDESGSDRGSRRRSKGRKGRSGRENRGRSQKGGRGRSKYGSVDELVDQLPQFLGDVGTNLRAELTGAIEVALEGKGSKGFVVDFKRETPEVVDSLEGEPDCRIELSDSDLLRIANGELNPQVALLSHKVKASGSLGMAIYFFNLFPNLTRR